MYYNDIGDYKMNYIDFGNTKLYYSLYEQERNDVKISVDLVSGVMVYTPKEANKVTVHNIIQSKAKWIYEKVEHLNEVKVNVTPKEFVSGEKLPYLGRQYRLKVYREAIDSFTFNFSQGKFIASVPSNWAQERVQTTLEDSLIAWYRSKGIKKIHERARYYENLLGVDAKSIQLKTQHKRWGTCTPEGNIYLNWRIVMAPMQVINYVIVHELTHLRIPEHNQAFWNLVKSILPQYEESKEWLRVYGMKLYCVGQEKT